MTTYIFTNRANNTVEAFTASQLTGKLCYEHDDKDMAAVAQEVGLREQLWETIMQYNTASEIYSDAMEYEDRIAYGMDIQHGEAVPTPDAGEASDDFYNVRYALCGKIVAVGGDALRRAYALCIGVDADNLEMSISE